MSETISTKVSNMKNLIHEGEFVFLDLETTSFNPDVNYGKIIEIAAIKVKNGEIVDEFETLINPQMKIPKKATEITNITDEMVKYFPTYEEVLPKFIDFCGNMVVVGHNVNFDIRFLDYYSQILGQKFQPEIIDTMYLAKYVHKDDKKISCFKLEHLAGLYGIDDKNHHRAMNDVVVTFELFKKLKEILEKMHQNHITSTKYRTLEKDLNIMDCVKVTKYSLWQKSFKGKKYSRLYVNLYYNGDYNYVFYDFIEKKWSVKELHFDMPNGYGNEVMKKISKIIGLPIDKCYLEETY